MALAMLLVHNVQAQLVHHNRETATHGMRTAP
jgi:hypothetical protein